jgi:hypothetical protein
MYDTYALSTHARLAVGLPALVGALVGAVLGSKLDRYLLTRHPRRRVPLPGSWYGYTPIAWLGGIVAARLLSGLAVFLAQIIIAPAGLLALSRHEAPFTMGIYFASVLAWMVIIGRAAARMIDEIIARRLDHVATRDAEKPAG